MIIYILACDSTPCAVTGFYTDPQRAKLRAQRLNRVRFARAQEWDIVETFVPWIVYPVELDTDYPCEDDA